MNKPGTVKELDLSTYSVHALYVAGMRFTDDYTEDDAVEQYMELHPGADEAKARVELAAAIAAA